MKGRMKEKMKRREKKEKMIFVSKKMFQDPQTRQMNQPKMFRKKSLSDELFLLFFCKNAESGRFFIYLHDSSSIFWAQGIKSEWFLGRTVLSHAAAAGRNKEYVVAVVDGRRAYFYAEPLPKTFVELPDYYDLDTRTGCCGRLRRCLCGTRQAARSWQREIEKGIKAAGVKGNDVEDVEVFIQLSMREIGGRRAQRRPLARRTEITC